MRIRVSSPGNHLKESDIDQVERDLEKIDRRLKEYREIDANVRISDSGGTQGFNVTLELDYGRNHLIARAAHEDMGRAVREAREDVLRQINDRSRGGHSSFSKGM